MNQFLSEAIPGATIVLALCSIGAIFSTILLKLNVISDFKSENNRNKKIGRFIAITLGIAYIIESIAKISLFEVMVMKWDTYNMTYLLRYVGFAELILGILLLFPKCYKISVLMLTAIAGGAMATHLPLHADGFGASVASGLLLSLLWLSAMLYTPEMFPEFIQKAFHKKSK